MFLVPGHGAQVVHPRTQVNAGPRAPVAEQERASRRVQFLLPTGMSSGSVEGTAGGRGLAAVFSPGLSLSLSLQPGGSMGFRTSKHECLPQLCHSRLREPV